MRILAGSITSLTPPTDSFQRLQTNGERKLRISWLTTLIIKMVSVCACVPIHLKLFNFICYSKLFDRILSFWTLADLILGDFLNPRLLQMQNKLWCESTTNPDPVLHIAALRSFSELTKNVIRSSHGHPTPFLKISFKSLQPYAVNVDK